MMRTKKSTSDGGPIPLASRGLIVCKLDHSRINHHNCDQRSEESIREEGELVKTKRRWKSKSLRNQFNGTIRLDSNGRQSRLGKKKFKSLVIVAGKKTTISTSHNKKKNYVMMNECNGAINHENNDRITKKMRDLQRMNKGLERRRRVYDDNNNLLISEMDHGKRVVGGNERMLFVRLPTSQLRCISLLLISISVMTTTLTLASNNANEAEADQASQLATENADLPRIVRYDPTRSPLQANATSSLYLNKQLAANEHQLLQHRSSASSIDVGMPLQPEFSERYNLDQPHRPQARDNQHDLIRNQPDPTSTSESSTSAFGSSHNNNNKPFKRINELETFLDDMNHNELSDVAAGKSIDNELFQPKALPGNSLIGGPHHQNQMSVPGEPASSSLAGENGEKQAEQPATGLDTAQSTERSSYSDCALILQRTYVKSSVDDPKHHPLMGLPFGRTEQACIGYKHINKAIEQAKHKLKFREMAKSKKKRQPGGPPELDPLHTSLEPPVDLIAALGEINMATTQILADQFDLSNDELLNGLPLIDMSKTNFWPICPLLVRQDLKCELSRFRSITGHCNNLKHPTWGAAMTPFARYLPPIHPDGIWTPRKSIISELTFHLSGEQHLPSPSIMQATHTTAMDHQDHHYDHFNKRLGSEAIAEIPNSIGDEPMHEAGSVQTASFAVNQNIAALASRHTLNVAPRGPSGENLIDTHYQRLHSEGRIYDAASGPGPIIEHHAHLHRHEIEDHSAEPRMGHPHPQVHHRRSTPAELPPVRLISTVVHHDVDIPNHDFSILFMSWGQLLDHDMTRAAQPPSTIKCCGPDENQPKHKLCLPIKVPEHDPFYSKFNVQCLEFRRSLAGLRPNCVLGPRVHQNAITSPIDANFVYGSSRAESDALRLFRGGRLRDRDWFKHQNLKPLLPAQEEEPDQDCLGRPKDLFCFLAGDVRANEQIHLTVLHTLYMREHNRIADRLAELNPHWNDERIFQETRHIVAASVQQVMINEYIPLLIGKKMASLYNLTGHHHGHDNEFQMMGHVEHQDEHNFHHHNLGPHHPATGGGVTPYWHGYDPSVTTSVSNSFAAAAFRQGHTFIQGTVERYNKFHEFIGSEKLRHLFKQPFLLYQPGALDELTSGLINQPAQSYDPFISVEIAGHLFQPPERQFGHDLASINLQRGREQGLPGYNLFREWCGLPRAETFDQLAPFLTNHTAFLYSRLYKHVDDIDLWSGGISERKLPGAAIGPTFACIIARQFSNTRRGDRFWFENPGFPSSFTPKQLAQIRKISLAKILCANSDDLPTIQRWALRMPHPVLNPRLPCSQLPEIDLRFWHEEEQK